MSAWILDIPEPIRSRFPVKPVHCLSAAAGGVVPLQENHSDYMEFGRKSHSIHQAGRIPLPVSKKETLRCKKNPKANR